MTPVCQLMNCEAKSCVFLRNKSIITMVLISNCCLLLKSPLSIILIYPVKIISHLNQERNGSITVFRSSTVYMLKYKLFGSCMDCLWIIVMYFISFLDSHSNGTHSLQRIHWWASDVMLSKSVPMKTQTQHRNGWSEGEYILILICKVHLHFWMNCPFKCIYTTLNL